MSATSPSSSTVEIDAAPAAVPGLSDSDEASAYCDLHDVRLCQVASHGWLVRTAEHPESAGNVLGCVEEHHGRFELMELGDGFRWSTFDTLRAAVAHLVVDTRRPGGMRSLEDQIGALEDEKSVAVIQ
jgi:hypothetical protein